MKRPMIYATRVVCALAISAASPFAAEAQGNGATGAVLVAPIAVGAGASDSPATPPVSDAQIRDLVKKKIKYVFVLYQENRSFDSYFGTFPGAEGIYSQPPEKTPGFTETVTGPDGQAVTVTPFRIGANLYAWDTDDVDHSHDRIVAKMNLANGVPQMDKFAQVEADKYAKDGKPTLLGLQMGELAMAHEDCDTIPFLWNYANRFVLFDHIFQDITGPSTPGNLVIFAGQGGQTQWALHPELAFPSFKGGPIKANEGGATISEKDAGVPVVGDNDPFWGSPFDPHAKQAPVMPFNPGDYTGQHPYGVQINQTYASLALTTPGKQIGEIAKADKNPDTDLGDVEADIAYLTANGQTPVNWGWYEEGFNREPTDTTDPTDANGVHASYITHHNGPQYFGYVANNPRQASNMHGLDDFFTALEAGDLPQSGGVFYVKGGYQNIFGLVPANPLAIVKKNFRGDDDHPAYSDAQISEALVAKAVNAIAKSPYWDQSAIIITWDDSEGDYDHVVPPVREIGPDKKLLTFGPRVPLIVVSPYAKTHAIATTRGSQVSVVKFVDEVFGLKPLALLPDELKGRVLGEKEFGQADLGPADALTPGIGDLMSAFDLARLEGVSAPLPASYATIPDKAIMSMPHYGGNGCQVLGITPTDVNLNIQTPLPPHFNPIPKTVPGENPY